jgi:hypothetical protein
LTSTHRSWQSALAWLSLQVFRVSVARCTWGSGKKDISTSHVGERIYIGVRSGYLSLPPSPSRARARRCPARVSSICAHVHRMRGVWPLGARRFLDRGQLNSLGTNEGGTVREVRFHSFPSACVRKVEARWGIRRLHVLSRALPEALAPSIVGACIGRCTWADGASVIDVGSILAYLAYMWRAKWSCWTPSRRRVMPTPAGESWEVLKSRDGAWFSQDFACPSIAGVVGLDSATGDGDASWLAALRCVSHSRVVDGRDDMRCV